MSTNEVPLDSIGQVKAAVDAGRTVYWANDGYQVIKGSNGEYLIVWNKGGRQENFVGLTLSEHGGTGPGATKFYTKVKT